MSVDEKKLSASGAARYLKVPTWRIFSMVHRNQIPHHRARAGKKLTFKQSAIDEWLEADLAPAYIPRPAPERLFTKSPLHPSTKGSNGSNGTEQRSLFSPPPRPPHSTRAIFKRHEVSMWQLAAATGVSRSHIRKIIEGHRAAPKELDNKLHELGRQLEAIEEEEGGRPELQESRTYETEAGSTVTVSGRHGGEYDISFDWVEEAACVDCDPYVYDGALRWSCDFCGGGSAKLRPVFDEDLRAHPVPPSSEAGGEKKAVHEGGR